MTSTAQRVAPKISAPGLFADGGCGTSLPDLWATYAAVRTLTWLEEPLGPQLAQRTIDYLLSRRNQDGGCAWQRGLSSDVWATYYGYQALRDLGHQVEVARLREWLSRAQSDDGGFGMMPGQGSDVWATYYASRLFREVVGVRPPAETRLIDWLGSLQTASAPANHAFGFLCGIGMAYLHRAAFTWVPQLDRYSAYEPIDGERILLTLTASWQLLTRTPQLIRGVSRVVHSAGPVPEFAREILSAERDCRDKLCEIFGSAEVGGLAFRRAAGESDTVWQLFDDVELKYCTSNNAWNVVGARVASLLPLENAVSDFRRMTFLDSEVEIADGRKIRIHGRRDMAIKVNGINVSLSELAETLGIALPDCPLALISERDPIRGEAFSVVMRSSNIPLARREHNERTVAAEIQRLYGEHVYPLRYSYSDIVERTASGKNKIILGSSRNG